MLLKILSTLLIFLSCVNSVLAEPAEATARRALSQRIFPAPVITSAAIGGYDSAGPSAITTHSISSTTSGHSSDTATLRSLAERLSERINVKHYGAIGNGSTDDSVAIQAALRAGGHVYVPSGTYRVLTGLTLTSNTYLELAPDAVLDFSSSAVNTILLSADGSEGAAVSLTANAAEHTSTATVADATGFATGDLVRVASTGIFDQSSTKVKIGEINQVASVNGGTVILQTPLRGTYTTMDKATMSKITPVINVHLSGGKILGGGTVTSVGTDRDHVGVKVTLGDHILIENVHFLRVDKKSIWLRDTINARILHNRFENQMNDSQAYGVSFDNAVQDSIAAHNTFIDVRHSLSTNNSTQTHGIPRRILFAHNTVYDSATSRAGGGGDAIDTHTAAEDIYIEYNLVYRASGQGINMECRSGTIIGNKIFYAGSNGIAFHNESDFSGSVMIVHNEVWSPAKAGIKVFTPIRGSTAALTSAVITNNRVYSGGATGIWLRNASTIGQFRNVEVSNNLVQGTVASSSIVLEKISDGSVSGNVVSDSGALNVGLLRINDSKNLTVTGNTLTHSANATGHGIHLDSTSAGATDNLMIAGNIVMGVAPSNLRGIFIDTDSTNIRLGVNNLANTTTPISGKAYTIVSGAITLLGDVGPVTVDTEGTGATDDLTTINGGFEGQVLILQVNSDTRDVTVKHGSGNIYLDNSTDKVLNNVRDQLTLLKRGAEWHQVSFSDSGT